MREHKYRAWDEEAECFSYSHLEDDNYVWGFEGGELKCWAIDDVPATREEPAHPESREIGTPDEHTGLEDKNGVEIYGGDILDVADEEEKSPSEVIYDDGCWRKKYKEWDKTLPFPELNATNVKLLCLEVIGNTHENPELKP